MNQPNDNNGFSVSEKTDGPRDYHRNPRPGGNNHKALVVIQDLSCGSLFPLLGVYFKQGPFLIYYQRATRGGLRLAFLLHLFGIATSDPLKIKDLFYFGTPNTNFWEIQYQVTKTCKDQLDRIESIIETYIPKCTLYRKKIFATNVSRAWQVWINEALLLHSVARRLGKQENIPTDHVILISRYASLLKILNLNPSTKNDVFVMSHPNQNKAVLYPLATVLFSILEVLQVFFKFFIPKTTQASKSFYSFKLGAAAAWGTEGMDKNQKDDLYWWRNSSIAADRLFYMFERENIQPTRDRVGQVKNLGIESVALNSKFPGDYPNLIIPNIQNQSLFISVRRFCLISKLAWTSFIKDEFSQAVLALVCWQYFKGKKLSDIYKKLNLKGIFHFEEAGLDLISLASDMSDSIRIGTHWASHAGINQICSRNHQVYFLWGHHDAQLALDAGSISKNLLLSGCFLSDHSNNEEHQNAQKKVQEMRKQGVRYILTLFDGSSPSPDFYGFFLNWLIEDPHLGLLIKGKGELRIDKNDDNLNDLFIRAEKTNRLYVMDHTSSPGDAATLSDFSVGISTISALVVAAIQGAKIIFLDYEKVDQGPQKQYCILHSLGHNRCVFYETKLLRQAITDFFTNPAANPNLGNATPILDKIDPFRDGKASQRIGEFVASYLEELDNGSSSDDAVRVATDRYAQKWGQDKVIRRI